MRSWEQRRTQDGVSVDVDLDDVLQNAGLESAVADLWALRSVLDDADALRTQPLLHVPLLGAHESVAFVVLAAILLLGSDSVYTKLVTYPLLQKLGVVSTTSPLDVGSLSRCAVTSETAHACADLPAQVWHNAGRAEQRQRGCSADLAVWHGGRASTPTHHSTSCWQRRT